MTHNPTGSQWHRWDLHFHTPSSFDYQDGSVTNEQIVECLKANDIRVVAITDHHVIDVARIRELQSIAGHELTVLPGIEFRSDQGGNPIHFISLFPEDCRLEHVWDTLKGKHGLTPEAIEDRGGHEGVSFSIKEVAATTHELGGLVSIHAGKKTNSIEEIPNAEVFQRQIKANLTREHVDIFEVGKYQDVSDHLGIIFPAIGKDLPLIMCSDNHNAKKYTTKMPLWLRADPVFRGLKMVIREPMERVFLGDMPEGPSRVRKNPTKYIRGIDFDLKPGSPTDEKWFSGGVRFNHGLVAIIGNKGSGKSALADTLGLLGASANSANFSFLSPKRFRHPQSGRAHHFDATIIWECGTTHTQCLGDDTLSTDVARIQYLPQEHVETVCNELVSEGGSKFEEELKGVIFSHVPLTDRHGQVTLDGLLQFHAGKKRERIDTLLRDLRKVARERCELEAKAEPSVRTDLSNRLNLQQQVLAAHVTKKPETQTPPEEADESPDGKELTKEIAEAEKKKDTLTAQIKQLTEKLSGQQTRRVIASRVLEALDNLEADVKAAKDAILLDSTALGLTPDALVSLTVRRDDVIAIREECTKTIAECTEQLNGPAQGDAEAPPTLGARGQLEAAEKTLEELKTKLDEPNRLYQQYLKQMQEWEKQKAEIEGGVDSPDSINGLIAAIEALDGLPAQIDAKKAEMKEVAGKVYSVKEELAELYRTLYEPVQTFMATNDLAKGKLQFRVEFATSQFTTRFLQMIAKNKKGTFKGVDEGYTKVTEMLADADWEDATAALQFVEDIDNALHSNQQAAGETVTLSSQVAKEHSPEDLLNYLYGLEYLEPRYLLKWDDKDLGMLSPGERGTVLLVFYLLIDKNEVPLVIDQPEGNLDNHTVAKILVDCIRETRKRRQVFIVTHNPNLAVVCDADQVVHAALDKEDGNAITYTTGALENPEISTYVTDVLEGTMWAFDIRSYKYAVGLVDSV